MVLSAALLLSARGADGAGSPGDDPTPVEQLLAGDECVKWRKGSICAVPAAKLVNFGPGRRFFLLAGGIKSGKPGPKFGNAPRSDASTQVLGGEYPAQSGVFHRNQSPKPMRHLVVAELLAAIPSGSAHAGRHDPQREVLTKQHPVILEALLSGEMTNPVAESSWIVVDEEALLSLLHLSSDGGRGPQPPHPSCTAQTARTSTRSPTDRSQASTRS